MCLRSEINNLAKELKEWTHKHNLEEHTLASFFEYIENYREAEPEEFEETFPDFDKGNFDVHVQEVALSLDWQHRGYSSIIAHIPIVYRQAEIGWYRVAYSALGEILDAWWSYNT